MAGKLLLPILSSKPSRTKPTSTPLTHEGIEHFGRRVQSFWRHYIFARVSSLRSESA